MLSEVCVVWCARALACLLVNVCVVCERLFFKSFNKQVYKRTERRRKSEKRISAKTECVCVCVSNLVCVCEREIKNNIKLKNRKNQKLKISK